MSLLPKELLNEYLYFLLSLMSFIIFASIIHILIRTWLRKKSEQTKNELYHILNMLRKPLVIIIILIGFNFALNDLSIFTSFNLLIDRIFFIVIVLVFAFLISKISSVIINRWLQITKRFERTPILISRVISVVVYLIAISMLLGYFEADITPLVATLGIGGLAVGLALQNTLSNFFAGLHIISDRPINLGDFIELDENSAGYVEDIGWRSTRIRTLLNTIIIVPNSKLAETIITNYSLPVNEMAVFVECGVAYGSDLKKVEEITLDVAKQIQKTIPGAIKSFEPMIRYHTFADSNINFRVILRVEMFEAKYIIVHEFVKELKRRYDAENIEISWPVRKIYYGE